MKYRESGVDIDAASQALASSRAAIRSTWGPAVASEVGSFGGLYRQADGSLLVSSIDGVGTKLKIALAARQLRGVGEDLVNHCVNDILVQGATPLFFLDYYGTGSLSEGTFVAVVEGLAKACRENGCALIGGETAEMPGLYHGEDFDLAGCIVGRVEEEDLITGAMVREGMRVYAWPSSGLHTNGFSLARTVLLEGDSKLPLEKDPGGLGSSLADALLAVHRSYLSQVRELRARHPIAALAHITGGGLVDNIPRVLPMELAVEIDEGSWQVPPIFRLLQERGRIEQEEMRRVFNLGLGMVVICEEISPQCASKLSEPPLAIGRVLARGEDAPVRFHAG
ncbi:MAG TPA: phosphoribosylformylglycinamidine cyclo-ligase [Candidatus Krumholzibacteria bacterium]|nr:phosphoribosylformylglycinamidine cyclo-ligase [Candidatus Krumholzibacteria bacterium]